ncbi:hypothetical protein C2G38_2174022 [Gigaspora rosea]|uniref:Uncharacterized protein n=1 Tax=Gigaspora rosea TaxID=44941 RepID=A0A397VK77_9GLOM|nr:hypothetical protein C2G38_2174022 [Gigaspora rosea]
MLKFFYHAPWCHPKTSTFFGSLRHTSYTAVDYTMIERTGVGIDLIPQIRSSDDDFPSLFIESFGKPTAVGQHICISGYVIYITCGGTTYSVYGVMLKMEIFDVNIHEKDRGGTVFSYLPSIKHQRVVAYGIVTYSYEWGGDANAPSSPTKKLFDQVKRKN